MTFRVINSKMVMMDTMSRKGERCIMYMPPKPKELKRQEFKTFLVFLAIWAGCIAFVFLMTSVVRFVQTTSADDRADNASANSSASASDLPAATPRPTPTPIPTPAPTPMSAAALDEAAAQFPLRITGSNYILGLTDYDRDAFQATLENGSDQDILDARIVLEAWDSNGLPIDLKLGSDYGIIINYNGINLVPQGTFSDAGYKISYNGASNRISYYKAVVLDYTTAQGETVTNPYIEEWVDRYEGKKLEFAAETYASPQEMMEAGVLNGTLSAVKNIIPTAMAGEHSYGGTVTATESGFLLTYDFNPGFMEGNSTLTQGYGNAAILPLVTYGAVPLAELRDGLQKYCGIQSPVFTVNLVDANGNITYSEDITSDTIDTMNSLGS